MTKDPICGMTVDEATALHAAHVGIAMGTGTDVAMESAGITLSKATCAASPRPSP